MAKPVPTANVIVESELTTHVVAIERLLDADVIAFIGPLVYGVDEIVRNAIEELHPVKRRGDKLVVVLETLGGYIGIAEKLVTVFRHHYRRVEFIIPHAAMSAGTVLVMSGDAIHMDYFSVLGPIDPQIERPDGRMVPALGYLEKFKELVEKSQKGTLTPVEAAYLLQRFDPAEMHQYEQAQNLTIDLLKDWLVRYKFRTWKKTERHGKPVSRKMKSERAAQIARQLNDTKLWHSHARGISMEVLRRKVKLRIEDFGAVKALKEALAPYYRLLEDYRGKQSQEGVVHTRHCYIPMAFTKRKR